MPKIPPLPELPPPEERPPWLKGLLEVIEALQEENHRLREENQALRDEVARLKKQKPKPRIRPSKLNDGERKNRGGKGKRGRKKRKPDDTVVVQPKHVPEGSRFKGYADYVVQDLEIKARTILYRLAKYITPEGEYVVGELPGDAGDGHFGPTLRGFVLQQHHHGQVTEPLILEELREWGVEISAGQVHRIVAEGKEKFHEEKDEILRIGLEVSGHIHTDDTGARHRGKNGYCTHIGNAWFAWFETTTSKSRINFLGLLRAGYTDYVISGEALEYMAAQKLPKTPLAKLASAAEKGDVTFADEDEWKKALVRWGITKERHVRIATEGALLGSALAHGLNPRLAIMSDDAGQFNVLCHALCWIHAERVLVKLVGFTDAQRQALDETRTAFWDLYRDLKAYKAKPTAKAKEELETRFDELCTTRTCFTSLNLALGRMHANKAELLRVLERPELPLHNNLSETDIREYVKRRKISGGTRSEDGRRGRDTFASLKKTCRKLGISFWKYLVDRVRGDNAIPPLPELIAARAQAP